ncbi:MAG: trimethylamine methyltransferase [Desulfobacterales bacterium]|nr:trimethylamine methyltransferase [Desulfobacterales bacterium]
MEYAELLKPREAKRVHDYSVEILENVGVLVRNEKARDIFSRHGCGVDSKSCIVKIPPKIVSEYRKAFVPDFTFRGRDPRFDKTLPGDAPVMATASSAPNIIDPRTGAVRRASSTDIANIAFLVNELPGVDVFSISTLADDAPKGRFSLSRFYPALKNCLKPVRGNTPNMKELLDVLELGAIIAGGPDAYKERPLITHHTCPMVSPLTMDVDSTETMIHLVERGFPVYGSIVPNAGMSTPMTLLGTLTVGNAEFLALNVLMQMVRPGTPTIYAILSTVADMRTLSYAPGAIETGVLAMGHAQMAGFYGVPSGGYIGLTGSHVNDAQSGYETGMDVTAALLGGVHLLNLGGLLSNLMTFDFGKLVTDAEIGLMLKRVRRSFEFSEENFALDVIAEIGPGGNYMDHDHTVRHMRSTAVLPRVATREMNGAWEQEGRLDAEARALNEAKKILSKSNPAVLPPEIDAGIRARFKDLIPGDAGF